MQVPETTPQCTGVALDLLPLCQCDGCAGKHDEHGRAVCAISASSNQRVADSNAIAMLHAIAPHTQTDMAALAIRMASVFEAQRRGAIACDNNGLWWRPRAPPVRVPTAE